MKLSRIERKIADALGRSPHPLGLIDLMVNADTAYSSASVTTRAMIKRGLAESSLCSTGTIYRLTAAGKDALLAAI